MTLDDTAAAYGLFQVVFADVVDHLAGATFLLRERKEPGLTFEKVFRQELAQILKQFRCELLRFAEEPSLSDSLIALRQLCNIISELSVWRNDRIHAHVRLTEHGYALYNWRTRRRLEITREQIQLKINLAMKVMAEIKTYVSGILRSLTSETSDEEFAKLFDTLPEFSEAPDDTGTD
jgi:hypothetical protein